MTCSRLIVSPLGRCAPLARHSAVAHHSAVASCSTDASCFPQQLAVDAQLRELFCRRVAAGSSSSRFLEQLSRRAGWEPAAAVLVPLCISDGHLSLLYTVRPRRLRRHGGEVAFPGGLRAAQDDDLMATAIRETHEELGIEVSRSQVWCALADCPSTSTGRVVRPFFAELGVLESASVRACPHEVEHVFVRSVADLCRPEKRGHTQFRRPSFSAPVFLNGPRRVWGLSAIFTHLALLGLVPQLYNGSHVRFVKPLAKS